MENYFGFLGECLTEFLVQKRGRGGGIATLDENAKVPKSQLPEITPLSIDAMPRYTKALEVNKVGWYRIGEISVANSGSFMLNVDRQWGNGAPEGFSLLIRILRKSISGTYGVNFLQNSAMSNVKYIDKVRIVINHNEQKALVDLHYSGSQWNKIYVRIDNIAQSEDVMNVNMESMTIDPEIQENEQMFEHDITSGFGETANVLREWRNPTLGNPDFHMGDTVRFENLGTADEYFQVINNSQIPYGSLVFINKCYIAFTNTEISHWTFIIYNSHVVFGSHARLTTPSANIYAALESDIQGISNPQLNIQNIRNTSVTGCNIAGYCHILNNAKFFSCYFNTIGIDFNLCQMTECNGSNINATGMWKLSAAGIENKYPL